MTDSHRCDLTAWSIQWHHRVNTDGLPFNVMFTDPRDGRFVAHVAYRGKSMDLTLDEPATHDELEGTLNMIGWGLRHAAGEITAAELRAALGLPAGLTGIIPTEASRP